MDFTIFAEPATYVSLLTLTLLEIILGIDNIVFITILAGKLPKEQQLFARRIGLAVALVTRILLLLAISWVMGLKDELFSAFGKSFSGKDLILIGGGLFLMAKATHEIYENVEHPGEDEEGGGHGHGLDEAAKPPSFTMFLIQVGLLDIVFSLDSVITAVGVVEHVSIMVIAVLGAVGVMLAFAGPIGDFVQKRASVRVLALAFLVLIGFVLLFEGFERHVPKGYVYFAMAFALGIELLNMRMRKKRSPRQKLRAESLAMATAAKQKPKAAADKDVD